MARIDIRPRKQPRQARSQATVALILEAATRVLSRESLEGFNTNRVAELAGVSVGSLYQYFPNKAALITALIDSAQTALAEALEQLVQSLEGQSLQVSLRAVAQLAIAQQFGHPLLAAALDHEERRLPVQAQLQRAERRVLRSVETLLARHRNHLADPLPAAAKDCLVLTRALVEADTPTLKAPPADLEDRIVRALWGYLTSAMPE